MAVIFDQVEAVVQDSETRSASGGGGGSSEQAKPDDSVANLQKQLLHMTRRQERLRAD
jgi:hypothetical protein